MELPMTTRYNPFEELERLFDRMSEEFADASRTWESGDGLARWPLGADTMRVDLASEDDELVATADLPGFGEDDVDVRVADHTLEIQAEHTESSETEDTHYLRRERHHRSLRRTIELPEEIDADNVTARMKDGVLTVRLPKVSAEESRKIEISIE